MGRRVAGGGWWVTVVSGSRRYMCPPSVCVRVLTLQLPEAAEEAGSLRATGSARHAAAIGLGARARRGASHASTASTASHSLHASHACVLEGKGGLRSHRAFAPQWVRSRTRVHSPRAAVSLTSYHGGCDRLAFPNDPGRLGVPRSAAHRVRRVLWGLGRLGERRGIGRSQQQRDGETRRGLWVQVEATHGKQAPQAEERETDTVCVAACPDSLLPGGHHAARRRAADHGGASATARAGRREVQLEALQTTCPVSKVTYYPQLRPLRAWRARLPPALFHAPPTDRHSHTRVHGAFAL